MPQDPTFPVFFADSDRTEEENAAHWSANVHCSFQNTFSRWRDSSSLTKPMPKIALMVFENNKPDACAQKTDFGYSISLNSGLYRSVNQLFRTTLAHPTTFLSIGNFLLEKMPKSTDSTGNHRFANGVIGHASRTPVDDTRLAFADHLTELTMRFVIDHELGHILAGHLDYKPQMSELAEVAGQRSLAEAESFALEMHADELAFYSCFYWIMDSLSGNEQVMPKTIFMETVDAQLHDLYVATYALFQLFSHLTMSETHPSPLHRQIRLGVMFDWMCKSSEISLINKPIELVGQALHTFNKYMEHVFQLDWQDRKDETDYILSKGMENEIAPYSEMVTSMYPALKPHSFLKLE